MDNKGKFFNVGFNNKPAKINTVGKMRFDSNGKLVVGKQQDKITKP